MIRDSYKHMKKREGYTDKALHTLKDIAPTLVGSLTGLPVQAIFETLSGIFSTKEGEKEEEVYRRIAKNKLSQEEYAKLKIKEMELHLAEVREENKRLALQLDAVRSAREKDNNFSKVLASVIFTGFFVMIICFACFPVEDDKEFYADVLHFLGDGVLCVSAYYFGSSFGGFSKRGGIASCLGLLHLFKRLKDSRQENISNRETKRGD